MKLFPFVIAMLGMLDVSSAEDASRPLPAGIPGTISDGTPSPPALPLVMPDFTVKSTVVREMEVVEAPPMAGLPLVEGTITATVHLVEDPKLPDPPPPVLLGNPHGSGNFRRPGIHDEWARLVFVSATVYDHSRTLLRCHPNGNVGKEITAWSNLDFNHFGGFSTFEVKIAAGGVRCYELMVSVGDENTQQRAALFAQHGRQYAAPQIPVLPDDLPAYVIQDTAPDAEAVQLIEDLHQLYRCEGQRMKAAYQARIKAEAEQRAYFLANPPVPKDVTMNFWERDHPVGIAAETIKQGGGN